MDELLEGMIPIKYKSVEDAFYGIRAQEAKFSIQSNDIFSEKDTSGGAKGSGQATNSYGILNVTLYANASIILGAARFTNVYSLNSYVDWYVLGTGWEQPNWSYYLSPTLLDCSGTVYGIKYNYILLDVGLRLFPSSEQYDFSFSASQFI